MYSRISVVIITVLLAAAILASTLQAAIAQQQQQQPITEAIRQNPEVSAVTVADENATSVSLISTKPAQIAQAVSMIELQFHMHVVSKSIQPFPETVYLMWIQNSAFEGEITLGKLEVSLHL